MARTVTVSADVVVPVSAERAFGLLLDAEGQSRWMVGTTIYPLAGDVPTPEVGSRLVALTGVAHLGVLDEMEVTEYEPPRRWVVRHLGRVVRGDGIFAVDPEGTGCRVTWTEDLVLPFGLLGRVGWPIVRPAVRWGLRLSLRRYAALLSAG